MSPFLRNKKKRPAKTFFATLAMFFIVAVFAFYDGAFLFFSGGIVRMAAPIQKEGGELPQEAGKILSNFRTKTSLYEENTALRDEIKHLKRELEGYDYIIAQNIKLREIFFRKEKKGVIASVISRPNASPFDTFILDAGQDAKISEGNFVLADSETALGTIEKTFAKSSKASLFSTPGRITDVALSPNGIALQLRGEGGGSFTAKIPKDLDARVGDIAFLAGSKEYAVGKVIAKEVEGNEPFQTLFLRIPGGMYDIKYVEVLAE